MGVSFRSCVIDCEVKEAVAEGVCAGLVEVGVREEIRGVAEETLAQAKQLRKEQLETLRQSFQQKQLLKYWNR